MARLVLVKLILIFAILGLVSASATMAQVKKVDPDDVIAKIPDKPNVDDVKDRLPSSDDATDRLPTAGDVTERLPAERLPAERLPAERLPAERLPEEGIPNDRDANPQAPVGQTSAGQPSADPIGDAQRSTTYQKDDVLAAATGVFGKGAKGLGSLVESIFKKQGEPNGYIIGREGGAALVFGLRYGSGTLYHKIEGDRPVYWNGPSVGFDVGANAASTFVLVYNLYDSEDLYRRYPAGEGAAYLVGGFNASYLRRGDVVLIPIRLGVGARLGVNAGYMKFRKKRKILPF